MVHGLHDVCLLIEGACDGLCVLEVNVAGLHLLHHLPVHQPPELHHPNHIRVLVYCHVSAKRSNDGNYLNIASSLVLLND